ncbi:MAG: hypothetical protein ACXWQZ_22635, partial [Ktedonobacterales bacterium]
MEVGGTILAQWIVEGLRVCRPGNMGVEGAEVAPLRRVGGEHMATTQQSIDVNVPVRTAYNQW